VERGDVESVSAIKMEFIVESVALVDKVPSLVDISGNIIVVEVKVKSFFDVKIEPVDK
jgi:hypothetical protein